ncbi:MAG: hypothetical protein J0M28_11290 [Thauera sp.]|nr:hypothetical protein [Thauera sp.]
MVKLLVFSRPTWLPVSQVFDDVFVVDEIVRSPRLTSARPYSAEFVTRQRYFGLVVPGFLIVRAAMLDLKQSGTPAPPAWMTFYCTNALQSSTYSLEQKDKHCFFSINKRASFSNP